MKRQPKPTDGQCAADFEATLGLRFHDRRLLTLALTHPSFVNEQDAAAAAGHNERLEFLGDAVIDLIVADMLYRKYPRSDEGDLSQLRAALVKTESLAGLAAECRLGEFLRVGRGEELTGGRQRQTMLCRAYEALVGAIFIDRGLDAASAFARPSLSRLLERVVAGQLHIDARSQLQERVQARQRAPLEYRVIGEAGPEHAKEFEVEVAVGDAVIGRGSGGSKRAAAQAAARSALDRLDATGLPAL